MVDDPIVAEVRPARQQHAAKFDFDLQAIYEDLKQQEAASDRCIVTFPPRKRLYARSTSRPKQQVQALPNETVLA
jgi:hypothetical protein